MRIYIASSNKGKLADFRYATSDLKGFEIEPLPGLSEIPAPPENEETFEGNARAKAIYYSRFAPGAWVMADDSGLEVDALQGRPGVRSARFAMDLGAAEATDAANNAGLLQSLAGVSDRAGRYRCALAMAMDGVVEAVAFGKLDGVLLEEPSGSGGFGYDPLFFAPEVECTMAEVSNEERLRVSHRGRALRSLLRKWRAC